MRTHNLVEPRASRVNDFFWPLPWTRRTWPYPCAADPWGAEFAGGGGHLTRNAHLFHPMTQLLGTRLVLVETFRDVWRKELVSNVPHGYLHKWIGISIKRPQGCEKRETISNRSKSYISTPSLPWRQGPKHQAWRTVCKEPNHTHTHRQSST